MYSLYVAIMVYIILFFVIFMVVEPTEYVGAGEKLKGLEKIKASLLLAGILTSFIAIPILILEAISRTVYNVVS